MGLSPSLRGVRVYWRSMKLLTDIKALYSSVGHTELRVMEQDTTLRRMEKAQKEQMELLVAIGELLKAKHQA